MKKRFSEQQIIAILKEGESCVPAREICRKHNISDGTYYTWRKKYAGMEAQDIQRLKSLDDVRHITNDWIRRYNEQRPHRSLGKIPPSMFRENLENSSYELST